MKRIQILGMMALFLTALIPAIVVAEELAQPDPSQSDVSVALGLIAIGSGLGIGVAAAGGALGQGKTAAAALEGVARNPEASGKLLTPMILGLALIESLVILAMAIAYLLQAKI